jgi:hypothetical protein
MFKFRENGRVLTPSTHDESFSQDYLTGLRGLLVLESLAWIFFHTFIPSLVFSIPSEPLYLAIFRKTFSVPLWNASLIRSFFIILSARTVCVHYLHDPTTDKFSGSLIRRPIRIAIPLAIATTLAAVIFSKLGTGYISTFADVTENPLIEPPASATDPIQIFNAFHNLLWTVQNFFSQEANALWPSHDIWVASVIYLQSYTVYIAMVILPFTQSAWRPQAFLLFIVACWWMDSWGWYSGTGLFLADISLDPALRQRLKAGFPITTFIWCPYWFLAGIITFAGLVLKFIWVTIAPAYLNAEITMYPVYHFSDDITVDAFLDTGEPYPRMDDYLVVVGLLVLVEIFEPLQKLLSTRFLKYAGKRSLSECYRSAPLRNNMLTGASRLLHHAITLLLHSRDTTLPLPTHQTQLQHRGLECHRLDRVSTLHLDHG